MREKPYFRNREVPPCTTEPLTEAVNRNLPNISLMDLLRNASYNDGGGGGDEVDEKAAQIRLPPPKRPKPECSNPICKPSPPFRPSHSSVSFRREAPIPGRYVSKRERAALNSGLGDTHPNPPPAVPSTLVGCISDSNLPCDILSLLRKSKGRDRPNPGRISGWPPIALNSHTKAVSAIQWSPSHPHLLASAGLDHSICIWNVWSKDQKIARVSNYHNAAVKDVKWSPQEFATLSCGYDCSIRLTDVETGTQKQIFMEDQTVGVTKFHPSNFNLFLSGGSKGFLRLWDVRTTKVVHQFARRLGPILDIDFTVDGKQFISSSDVSGSLVSENSIIVWDVSRQVPLSNQVYVEAYTCPCIRTHPFDPYFVAQSQGNYIAIFSSKPPFRLDKYRRFENHGVSGFPIKCNFSLDGQKLASGSSDGSIYFYNSRSSELIKKIRVYDQACTDVAFHPVIPNVIVSCSWNGEITVLKWDDTIL